jgi:hypothetical protein
LRFAFLAWTVCLRPELAALSSPKAYPTDPRIERTWQIIAKSNQANVAAYYIAEFGLPIVDFKGVVAKGPIMILDLWA